MSISTSVSGVNKPNNSDNGIFVVNDLRLDEKISIVVSKTGFTTNSDKINNEKVIDLFNAKQEERDIPLFIVLPPCDAGSNGDSDVSAGTVSAPQSFNMGVNSGIFDITYETGSNCSDCIDIYNHKPGEDYMSGTLAFSTGQVATDGNKTSLVRFDNGSVITVVVTTGSQDGSLWEYYISCPY